MTATTKADSAYLWIVWLQVEAESEVANSREVEFLEKDISELKLEIAEITAVTYELEKRAEELADSRGYLHEDDVRLYKKTNHQLHVSVRTSKNSVLSWNFLASFRFCSKILALSFAKDYSNLHSDKL